MAFTKTNFPMASVGLGGPIEGVYTPTVDQQHRLGEKYEDGFGRVWRYAKNGATALAPALMCAMAAPEAETIDEIQTGYSNEIGATTIRALLTTSNEVTDGELADGWLVVNKSTGLGYTYPIANNWWITTDTVMAIELFEGLRVATSATSEFSIFKNPYRDVVVDATTTTGLNLGIPAVVVPSYYYCWLQRKGPCAVVMDTSGVMVVGSMVGHPDTQDVAGAAGLAVITESIWGQVLWPPTSDAEVGLIQLMLE